MGSAWPQLAPAEVGDDLPADADAVELVRGEVVGEPGHARVHVRPAERLVVGVLAGGHLDQRRAAEEDLGLLVDEHRVVAHAGDVGAARGRVAEDQGDGRDARRGQLGEVVEDLARRDEQVRLRGQVRAARLDQVDDRQPVPAGDLKRAQRLAQRVGVHRAAAHRRVVRDQHALHPGHHADGGDHARAHRELGAPRGDRGQFEHGRVPVDEQLHALAGQEAPAVAVPLGVPRSAARPGQLELLVQRRDGGELAGPVPLVHLARDLDAGAEHRHGRLQAR